MKIYHTAADLVGRTPLLELGRIENPTDWRLFCWQSWNTLTRRGASRIESLRR